MNKPREFWISLDPEIKRINASNWSWILYVHSSCPAGQHDKQRCVHVIDYAAYAEAVKMLEEMAGALQQKACFCNNNWQTGPTICIRCEVLDKYKQWKAGE